MTAGDSSIIAWLSPDCFPRVSWAHHHADLERCVSFMTTCVAKGENNFVQLDVTPFGISWHSDLPHASPEQTRAVLRRRLDCCWHEQHGLFTAWVKPEYPASEGHRSHSGTDSPPLPLTYPTCEAGNKSLCPSCVRTNTWNRESTSYFSSTLNLIILHSFLCTWQLSQPQIQALSTQTICSCNAIFNWHFSAKPQHFAVGFFHDSYANKAACWPTYLSREGTWSFTSVTKQKTKCESRRFWLKGSEQMASRLSMCTWARLHVFTPCRNLATQGEIPHTKQVVLVQCELGLIQDFSLSRRSWEPCNIPVGLLLWPGVTASREFTLLSQNVKEGTN